MNDHKNPNLSKGKFQEVKYELNRPCITIALILGILLIAITCSIGSASGFLLGSRYYSHRISEGLVVINQADLFVFDIA